MSSSWTLFFKVQETYKATYFININDAKKKTNLRNKNSYEVSHTFLIHFKRLPQQFQ